ncbi:MAG TPA: secretin N-terminal domain-containing protein [Burkholderiales bacterium]|nr:secretin N-terminal domain-containing protein [Burkholderiales bacterium]
MTRLACLAAALLFALQAVAAPDDIHVITLKHRTAQELVPVIRPLLGPTDAVSAIDYRLLIRTSPKRLADVERIVQQLDVAQRNLTLTVRQGSQAENRGTSQGLSGEVDVGQRGRITLPRSANDDRGAVIEHQSGDARLRYQTRTERGSASDNRTQTLRVQDGKPAYIRLGQSVPHVKRIIALSGQQLAVVQGVEYQNVVTGFEVLPRVQGERVQLEITPRLSSLVDPASGLANFQELRTTVNVRLGEWIDLGGISGAGENVRRAIVESATAGSTEQRSVWLKVE